MIEPNPHLLAIERVMERMDERDRYVRLDRNEHVDPWPEATFRAMLAGLMPEHFCYYPDPSKLYAKLSTQLGMPEDHLYLTNGSDAAIRMIFQTFLRPGELVLLPDPTYAMYPIYTRIFGGAPELVPYGQDAHLDVDQLIGLLTRRPRLVAVANPDQPTGAVHTDANLRRLAAAAQRAGSIFIIDEAYYPFFPHTAVSLVREFDNVVVTRTFSKIGGLAGLRLGYMVAAPGIIKHVQRIRGAHEVNAMAIAMGSFIADHPELSREYLTQIEGGRAVLQQAAAELGLGFPACPANFQLLRFHGCEDTTPICAALKQRGYLVKGAFASPCVRDCIRVTLASAPVIRGFATALRDVVRQMPRLGGTVS